MSTSISDVIHGITREPLFDVSGLGSLQFDKLKTGSNPDIFQLERDTRLIVLEGRGIVERFGHGKKYNSMVYLNIPEADLSNMSVNQTTYLLAIQMYVGVGLTGLLDNLDYASIPFSGKNLEVYPIHSDVGGVCIGRFDKGLLSENEPPHNADEQIFILSGEGQFYNEGKWHAYKQGDNFFIPRGVEHGIKTISTTYVLSLATKPIISIEGFLNKNKKVNQD